MEFITIFLWSRQSAAGDVGAHWGSWQIHHQNCDSCWTSDVFWTSRRRIVYFQPPEIQDEISRQGIWVPKYSLFSLCCQSYFPPSIILLPSYIFSISDTLHSILRIGLFCTVTRIPFYGCWFPSFSPSFTPPFYFYTYFPFYIRWRGNRWRSNRSILLSCQRCWSRYEKSTRGIFL